MPFFVVARAHFSVACGVCGVGAELCGRRSHGLEGSWKALHRFEVLGWSHELGLHSTDPAPWVDGLGAGRWRCPTCARRPLPAPDTAPLVRAPPGLLTFLCRADGAVKWSSEGDGGVQVASAGETGTGVAWTMAALPAGDGWGAIISRRLVPHGYVPSAVCTGFSSVDEASAWARAEVEADHRRLLDRRAATAAAVAAFGKRTG